MNKPIVLIVMDGVGETPVELGNMVMRASTPTLDGLKATSPWQCIKAHGDAVGLPTDDDMGNSEVGHNALGCGQIYSQGAKLVNESIESGSIYQSETWKDLTGSVIAGGNILPEVLQPALPAFWFPVCRGHQDPAPLQNQGIPFPLLLLYRLHSMK